MRKICIGICFFFLALSHMAGAEEHETYTYDYNNGYILNAKEDSPKTDIVLQFGLHLGEYLKWNMDTENFILSDSLVVGGNIDLTENKLTFDSDNAAEGSDVRIVANQGSDNAGEIRYNATQNRWEVSNDGGVFEPLNGGSGGGGLAPYIHRVNASKIQPGESSTFTIEGDHFDYNTQVVISDWPGSIDGVRYISSSSIEVDVTAGTIETLYSIVLSNGGLDSTGYEVNNGQDALQVLSVPDWFDLRSGGISLSHGNAAGNDIRYANGMGLVRDANGMYFTGLNPWSSWVKFETLQWVRGTNTTLEWVFTAPSSAMMVGIGSDATVETNTAQYSQGEVQAYFSNSTNLWGLYGNNGTIGGVGNQSSGQSFSSGAILKAKFENDGGVGSTFSLYQLPGSSPADWSDESNLIMTTTIAGSLNPDETNIMPFIIPRDGGSQRFIAVRTY